MKTIIKIVLILFISNSKSYAIDYYVSSSLGNNSNNGLSVSTPWKTLSKVNSFSFQPGDIIHFKRGDIWYNQSLYIKYSGTSVNPITYTDYGTGNLPEISGMGTLSNTISWTNQGSDIWTITLDNTIVPNWGYFYRLQRLYINGQEVLGAAKNIVSEVGTLIPDTVKFHYNQGTQLLTLHSVVNPNTLTIEFAFKQYALSFNWWQAVDGKIQYININNLKFSGGNISCINVLAGQHINLKSLDIGDKGNFGITISGGDSISQFIVVDSCLIDSRYNMDYTLAGTATGTSDRGPREGFYGRWSNNVELKNSTIKDYTHANINLQWKVTGKFCENYKIHDNYSTSSIAYGGRTVVDRGTYNLEFYNNTIDGSNVQNQLLGQNNHFHHNIIKDVKSSPLKHYHSGFGITVNPYSGEDVLNNIYENNLIMDCESGGIHIQNSSSAIVSGCVFRNNILVNNGKFVSHFTLYTQNQTSNIDLAFKISDNYDWATGVFTSPFTSNNIYQNNLCYVDGSQSGSNGNAKILYHLDSNDPNGWTTSPITITQFNSENGQNNDVISNNIEGDPLFVNLLSEDYHLQSTSPAIDAGVTPLATLDFEGNTIPYLGTNTDVGIYEFQGDINLVINEKINADIFVYPNPTSDLINISNKSNIEINEMKIFNSSGKIVYYRSGFDNYSFIINLKNYSAGIYYIKINTKDTIYHQKLIVY